MLNRRQFQQYITDNIRHGNEILSPSLGETLSPSGQNGCASLPGCSALFYVKLYTEVLIILPLGNGVVWQAAHVLPEPSSKLKCGEMTPIRRLLVVCVCGTWL